MSRILSPILLSLALSYALLAVLSPAASASQLLVTNIFNDRVDLYDLTATSATLAQVGYITSGSPVLDEPSNVIIGPDHRIYVSSRGTGKVLVYDHNGQPSAGPGGLGVYADLGPGTAPVGLAFGSDGKLYVADQSGDSVKVFDGLVASPIGTLVGPGPTPMVQPSGVDFGPDGKLYISTFGGGGPSEVFVWDGSTVSRLVSDAVGAGVGLYGGAGVEVTTNGNVFVASLIGNGIISFDSNGAPTSPFNIQIPLFIPPGASFPSNAPSDVISDGNDLLFAVLGSTQAGEPAGYPFGGLLRYTSDGNLIILAQEILPASSLALLESVPEPSSIGLGLAGAVVVGCCRYLKRRHPK